MQPSNLDFSSIKIIELLINILWYQQYSSHTVISVLQQWDLPFMIDIWLLVFKRANVMELHILCKLLSEKRWNVNGLRSLVNKLITLALPVDYQVLGILDEPTCTSVADHTW